ncbi:hypothetical protein GCM10017559_75660 [Streptosporangium longisporum]|uniref:Uncharacterized protein n=1 Tax=Streptosporangium longisporum TaxID=46187 RepID=A0ABP6LDA3_9ACTN
MGRSPPGPEGVCEGTGLVGEALGVVRVGVALGEALGDVRVGEALGRGVAVLPPVPWTSNSHSDTPYSEERAVAFSRT